MARLVWLVFGAAVHLGTKPQGQACRLQMGFKRRAAAGLHIFVSILALAHAVRLPMELASRLVRYIRGLSFPRLSVVPTG